MNSSDGKLIPVKVLPLSAVREFDTVNGAKGRGGSIDQAGTVIVDGMVYFNSGYSKFGANPGNVLLGFGLPDR